jgi:quercetin dioxygenase-like cupin family protein
MRMRVACLLLIGVIVAAAIRHHPGRASATTAEEYKSTLLAVGRFGEIDVFTQFISPSLTKDEHKSIWLSRQKTKGTSDLYAQSNILAPGGSTGWHSHPGHSLIIVTEGKVTNYEGHDPDCKPHIYTQGMGFVDLGGNHVHILRNEGDVEARTIAVQLIPSDTARRIDAAEPGNCHF